MACRALATAVLATLALLCAPLAGIAATGAIPTHTAHSAPYEFSPGIFGSLTTVGPTHDVATVSPLMAGGGEPKLAQRDLPEAVLPGRPAPVGGEHMWAVVVSTALTDPPPAELAPIPMGRAPPFTTL